MLQIIEVHFPFWIGLACLVGLQWLLQPDVSFHRRFVAGLDLNSVRQSEISVTTGFFDLRQQSVHGSATVVARSFARRPCTVGVECCTQLELDVGSVGAVATLACQASAWQFYNFLKIGRLWSLTYVCGAVVVMGMLINALLKQFGMETTTWRGTTYLRDQKVDVPA